MKADDKHRWNKIESDHYYAICLDYGCEKEMFNNTGYIYSRSGIVFGLDRPNCIKEEIESNKMID